MTTRNEIPQDLLDILVCPLDHAKVNLQGDELICESCGRAYPVRDGIPVMLVEEAKLPAGVESLDAFKAKFRDQIPQ